MMEQEEEEEEENDSEIAYYMDLAQSKYSVNVCPSPLISPHAQPQNISRMLLNYKFKQP